MVTVQCGIMFTVMGIISQQHLIISANKLNAIVSKYYDIYKMKPLLHDRLFYYTRLTRILDIVLHEHTHILAITSFAFKTVWEKAIFINLIIIVPLNALALSTLWFVKLSKRETIIMCLLISVSFSMIIFPMLKMAKQNKTLHKIGNYLPVIVPEINSRWQLLLKLKYEQLYHRLMFGPKYGPSIFTIGAVTYDTIFKVSLIFLPNNFSLF